MSNVKTNVKTNSCLQIFDELSKNENVNYTFTGRDDTFLIYTFLKNGETSPLDVLEEINSIAKRLEICDLWMKKSIIS